MIFFAYPHQVRLDHSLSVPGGGHFSSPEGTFLADEVAGRVKIKEYTPTCLHGILFNRIHSLLPTLMSWAPHRHLLLSRNFYSLDVSQACGPPRPVAGID
jgi:hypothetical protein